MKFNSILLAAGNSSRFGGNTLKQSLKIGGETVLDRNIEIIMSHPNCYQLVVVTKKEYINIISKKYKSFDKKISFTTGGFNRSSSVFNGLKIIEEKNKLFPILIHDSARPGVSHKIINNLFTALKGNISAVIPGLPMNDSIALKYKDSSKTIKRKNVYRIQTPQVFNYNVLKEIDFENNKFATDEAELVRKIGKKVKIISGDENLHKITTPSDFDFLNLKLVSKKYTRIGNGFDVHSFSVEKGPLTLCGIKIPYKYKLEGHSDADVAFHAITDAILGSLSSGDIGEHFPSSNIKWKDKESSFFLLHSLKILNSMDAEIINIDLTIICEKPNLSKFKNKMRKNIAKLCLIKIDQVSVKATTTEKLGFIGRKEGIGALCNVSVLR